MFSDRMKLAKLCARPSALASWVGVSPSDRLQVYEMITGSTLCPPPISLSTSRAN